MIRPYQDNDWADLVRFVSEIQEHERINVPELKSGSEIGETYSKHLLKQVAANDGVILMAQYEGKNIGMICAWKGSDDDQLLKEDFREHGYISDIYVSEERRRKGTAKKLLDAVESTMRSKGCKRMRVCSKASNAEAINFYKAEEFSPYEIIFSKSLKGA